ncbi:hypothetical protein M5S04_02890 [Avibacterium paragallinarum]|uniref:hypothetical protein n=1 Tax=Avibacterium paragallinarum TaxID=728 RepID=UPI00227FDEF4|nr:hypothetical protein [Avibacterium paragallinarum]WAL56118.1 hypothetical protein OY678_08990 [Avibacterium paragallinarum]WAM58643.1 hypothetical protein OW731_08760 [Avibacterium paragallinarum]
MLQQEKKKEIYLCDYQYNGKLRSFKVEAESWDDAREIVRAMGTAEVIGILYKEIHIQPQSLTARIVTRIAKFFGKVPQRKEF